MSIPYECPACFRGDHTGHDPSYGQVPGLIGGSYCPCTGGCSPKPLPSIFGSDQHVSDGPNTDGSSNDRTDAVPLAADRLVPADTLTMDQIILEWRGEPGLDFAQKIRNEINAVRPGYKYALVTHVYRTERPTPRMRLSFNGKSAVLEVGQLFVIILPKSQIGLPYPAEGRVAPVNQSWVAQADRELQAAHKLIIELQKELEEKTSRLKASTDRLAVAGRAADAALAFSNALMSISINDADKIAEEFYAAIEQWERVKNGHLGSDRERG